MGSFLSIILAQVARERDEQSPIGEALIDIIRDDENLNLSASRAGLRVALAVALMTSDVTLETFIEIFPPDIEILSPSLTLSALKKAAEANPSVERRHEDLMNMLFRFRVALGSLSTDEQDFGVLPGQRLINAVSLVKATCKDQERIMSSNISAYMERIARLRLVNTTAYGR